MLKEFIDQNYELEKLKPYEDFLIECSQKDYSGQVIHSHHILPKFMKGTNDFNNLINLNCIDHYKSHLILANCFDRETREYKGNIFSSLHITNWIEDIDNEIIIDLGKKISEIRKGVPRPRWIIEKMVEGSRNRVRSPEERKRIGQRNKENYASGKVTVSPNFKPPEGYYEKLSERKKLDQIGKENPFAKQIEHVESGKIFDCIKDAMTEFEIPYRGKMNKLINDGIFRLLVERSPTHENLKYGKRATSLIHVESNMEFRSCKDAIKYFNISSYPVLYRLINQGVFKYLDVEYQIPITSNFRSKTKTVIDNNSGQVYNSIRAVLKEFKISKYEFDQLVNLGEYEIFYT